MEKPEAIVMKGKAGAKCPDCGEKYDSKGQCSCNRSSAGKKSKPTKGKKAPAKKSGNRYGGLIGSDLRDF